MVTFALFLSGVFVGVLIGLFGIGGGILSVPLFTYLGMTVSQAVGTSTLTIVLASAVGTLQNTRNEPLPWRMIATIVFPALVTGQIGVYASSRLDGDLIIFGFVGLVLANVFFLLTSRRNLAGEEPGAEGELGIRGALVMGSAAGLIAGTFGLGGGIVVVPFLKYFAGYPVRSAIRVSLAVVLITTLSTLAGHAYMGNVDYGTGFFFGVGAILGARIGVAALVKIPEALARKSFVALMLFVAGIMLAKALA